MAACPPAFIPGARSQRGGDRVPQTPGWSLAKPPGFLLQQFPCTELLGGGMGPLGGGSGGLRWGAHLEASPRDSLLPLNPFPICGCFFLTPHHILPPSPPRGLGACLVPTEELWEEAEPTCAERFPPPRTSGCGQPLLNQAVVPSQPLAEGIGAAAELGEPQKGQCPRDANWGSGLAHFTLASIHAGRPEAWGWRRGQLSGWSPLIFVPIFLQQSTN